MPIPEDERRNDERQTDERLNDERLDHEPIDHERIADQLIAGQPIDDQRIDDKFEAHLKQFRPLAPQPLPVDSHAHAPRGWFVLAAWAAAAAAVVAVAVLAFHAQPGQPRIAPPVESFAIADQLAKPQLAKPQSLTIRSANALLATAPSFKDALDEMAFPPKPAPLPMDKHSAIAELSKEKTKL